MVKIGMLDFQWWQFLLHKHMIQKSFISKLAFSSISSYLYLSGDGSYIWMLIIQIIPASNEQPMLIRLGSCSLSGCQRLIQFPITLSFPGAYHLFQFSIFFMIILVLKTKIINHKTTEKGQWERKQNRVNREGYGGSTEGKISESVGACSNKSTWVPGGGWEDQGKDR